MFGLWKVTALSEDDSQGASRVADVVSCMNEKIEGSLYLPPYLRPNQCGIEVNSVVVGFLDDVTGKGAAFCGIDDADYGYFMDAPLQLKQTLSVTGNTSIGGDASIGGSESVTGDSIVSGNASVTGNVTAADCQIAVAGGTFTIQNPAWVDDGNGTDPDSNGNAKFKTEVVSGLVSSLANHTHTCAVGPTSTPVPVPIPG